jgi:hypothetical protein
MTQIKFWTLSASCVVVGILALLEIPATLWLQASSHEFRGMNLLIQQGEQYNALWQKVAARAYQLGQQDPGLKAVLVHQQINVTPSHPAAGAPAPSATPPPPPNGNP